MEVFLRNGSSVMLGSQRADELAAVIMASRDALPEPTRWRDAHRRLSEQLQLRHKENPIMATLRKTYSTRLGRIATAATAA